MCVERCLAPLSINIPFPCVTETEDSNRRWERSVTCQPEAQDPLHCKGLAFRRNTRSPQAEIGPSFFFNFNPQLTAQSRGHG